MSAELRMGVIGGGISRAHLPAERDVEGMRTVAVCDIDEVGARATIEKFVRRAHTPTGATSSRPTRWRR
jgi:predicted dehydrogenase